MVVIEQEPEDAKKETVAANPPTTNENGDVSDGFETASERDVSDNDNGNEDEPKQEEQPVPLNDNELSLVFHFCSLLLLLLFLFYKFWWIQLVQQMIEELLIDFM